MLALSQLGPVLERVHLDGWNGDVEIVVQESSGTLNSLTWLAANDSWRPGSGRSFAVGCLMHCIISAAALHMSREGVLQLDDAVGRYLPELAGTNIGDTVTIRHVMSHTAGFESAPREFLLRNCRDWRNFAQFLCQAPQAFRPGTVFDSQFGNSLILGEILGRITQMRLSEFVPEYLAATVGASVLPPDPADPAVRVPELWKAAVSDSTTSLADMVRFIRHATSNPSKESTTGSKLSSLISTETITLPPAIEMVPEHPIAFGLGAELFRHGVVGADGGGLHAVAIRAFPDGHVVGVRVAPRDVTLRSRLLDALSEHFGYGGAPAAGHDYYESLDLGAFVGTYRGGFSYPILVRRGDNATLHFTLQLPTGALTLTTLARSSDNILKMSPRPPCALALFFESTHGSPTIMLGNGAYKRVAASTVV